MPHSTYLKKKSFDLLEGTMNLRAEKGQKWKKPLKISKNGFLHRSVHFSRIGRQYISADLRVEEELARFVPDLQGGEKLVSTGCAVKLKKERF